MASRSPLADSSRFVISVAVGFPHVLVPALGFLDRVATTHERDPVLLVLVVLLALLALITYLLLAIIVELEQAAAALSPATVLEWLGKLAINIKLAVAFRICGFELYMIGNVVVLAARN